MTWTITSVTTLIQMAPMVPVVGADGGIDFVYLLGTFEVNSTGPVIISSGIENP